MVNYAVDPSVILPLIPGGTELDTFNGECLISLIGFMFENTRLYNYRIPFHVNFEEVNLRFYVKRREGDVCRRGVVFIKEFVPRRAICFVANTFFNERYSAKAMSHFYNENNGMINLGYHWKHSKKWNRIEAMADSTPSPMLPGSAEEFIAEHYRGYSKYNHTTTVEYTVEHPAWEIFKVHTAVVDCDFASVYGNKFSMLQQQEPASVLVAKGSPVRILNKRNLPALGF